jgi:hypothetical protein
MKKFALWLSIYLVLAALGTVSCTADKEVARIAVPDTNLFLVLSEDEKQMFRYQVLADNHLVSDNNFLGPHDRNVDSRPAVTTNGNTIRFTWAGPYITQFVEFSVTDCEIAEDSGGTFTNRKIPKCVSQRKRAGP